jgi:hypothetical protein
LIPGTLKQSRKCHPPYLSHPHPRHHRLFSVGSPLKN